MNANIMIMT